MDFSLASFEMKEKTETKGLPGEKKCQTIREKYWKSVLNSQTWKSTHYSEGHWTRNESLLFVSKDLLASNLFWVRTSDIKNKILQNYCWLKKSSSQALAKPTRICKISTNNVQEEKMRILNRKQQIFSILSASKTNQKWNLVEILLNLNLEISPKKIENSFNYYVWRSEGFLVVPLVFFHEKYINQPKGAKEIANQWAWTSCFPAMRCRSNIFESQYVLLNPL